jgi:arginine N-succinyltransferase
VYLIRRAKVEDVGTLLKLAKMVYFINLPADKDIITSKVLQSRACFIKAAGGTVPAEPAADAHRRRAAKDARESNGKRRAALDKGGGISGRVASSDMFMFALEDTDSGSVLGTSQVVAHMGGPGDPNVSFRLAKREFFSESLQSGASHMTVKLHLDESGPTEIGGLILQPSFRRHTARLGRFLSLVRFHFMGLHRPLFADRVIAEMMAPITPDGQNLLWEYLGRRFINLTYSEADRFCQQSREFMTALLPREEIYLTLLPPEARALVAQVGPETIPARKLLENLGFQHHDLIDPFDGGPYLQADTDKITIVKGTRRLTLGEPAAAGRCTHLGMVSSLDEGGEFRAMQTPLSADPRGHVRLPAENAELLAVAQGAQVGVTVMEPLPPGAVAAASSHAPVSPAAKPAPRPKKGART